jgi:hypothetical protein
MAPGLFETSGLISLKALLRETMNHTNGAGHALIFARIPGKSVRVYTNHTNRKEQSEYAIHSTSFFLLSHEQEERI